MPITRKVLGQAAPAATTWTALYTVPAVTTAIISTFSACNKGPTDIKIRVAVRPGGAALADQHFEFYDFSVPANNRLSATEGFTLGAADVFAVWADQVGMSFALYGQEMS